MNKDLEAQVGELLKGLIDAKDFVIGELPLIAQEKLSYDFYHSAITIVFWFIATLVIYKINKFVFSDAYGKVLSEFKYDNIVSPDYSTGGPKDFMKLVGIWALNIIGSLVGIIVVCECISNILQIQIAPRLYLLEYASKLLKGGSE